MKTKDFFNYAYLCYICSNHHLISFDRIEDNGPILNASHLSKKARHRTENIKRNFGEYIRYSNKTKNTNATVSNVFLESPHKSLFSNKE